MKKTLLFKSLNRVAQVVLVTSALSLSANLALARQAQTQNFDHAFLQQFHTAKLALSNVSAFHKHTVTQYKQAKKIQANLLWQRNSLLQKLDMLHMIKAQMGPFTPAQEQKYIADDQGLHSEVLAFQKPLSMINVKVKKLKAQIKMESKAMHGLIKKLYPKKRHHK